MGGRSFRCFGFDRSDQPFSSALATRPPGRHTGGPLRYVWRRMPMEPWKSPWFQPVLQIRPRHPLSVGRNCALILAARMSRTTVMRPARSSRNVASSILANLGPAGSSSALFSCAGQESLQPCSSHEVLVQMRRSVCPIFSRFANKYPMECGLGAASQAIFSTISIPSHFSARHLSGLFVRSRTHPMPRWRKIATGRP
jgi:hypothetical protein